MVKLAHTADVHWRGLSRHDEYREVFSAFVKDCKKNKVDHIFVGGDIFHTKTTGISPEYIEQLTWWLKSLAQVAPVHLILGNHDGNLTNLSRQDAVSPIVQAINNPNIHLYKKSGVYEFEPGYNFCVYSLFDEEGWENVKPEPGKINIACYHGPVLGCVTETGWEIDETHMKVDFFKDYPYTFLGDIHKMQFLGYRDTASGEKKPWIAYSGCPVQQNYAEEVDHGYLLWDIKSKDDWNISFRKLPNPKPFVTLSWSGSQKDFLKEAQNYPKQSRFRIKTSNALSQDDVSFFNDVLKNQYNATEVTFKSEYKAESETIKAGSVTIAKSDLSSPEVILSLIQTYAKENGITEYNWDTLTSQVKKYLSTVSSSDDMSRGSKWTLKHMKWHNTFSYGEDNEIDFSKLNGIIGIFGSNRIGKSSIVGTLVYNLFNTTDRGSIKNLHVCNIRKPYCYARSIFEHNGNVYVAERQTSKSVNKKGITSATTSLNFFKMKDDSELEDLCGDLRTDTEKAIRSLIGTHEDFSITSLSAQGDINAFISQGSAKRRSFLSRFLGLDVFDKMADLANKDLSGFKAQLKNFPDRNWDELKNQCNDAVVVIKHQLDELEALNSHRQSEISDLKTELSTHKDVKVVTPTEVINQEKRVATLLKSCDDCTSKITNLTSEIQLLRTKLELVEQVESSNDVDDLKQQLLNICTLERSLTDLRYLHDKEATQLKQHQKSLKILDDVPCGDEYPTCKFIKDAHQSKEKLNDQVQKTDNALKRINELSTKLTLMNKENLVSRLDKLEKAITLSAKFKLEISKKETEIAASKASCESIADVLRDSEQRLRDLQTALKNEENTEVVSIRSKIELLSKQIKISDELRLSLATQRGKLLSDVEKLNNEKSSRDVILRNMKTYEIISGAFSKKGIPLIITRSQIPAINAEITKILHGIVDFEVEIENDDDSDASEIYINYGDSRRIIELCSGMEKTISSIALRVALINVSSMTKCDMFIIDEGFGTLDDAGVESCNRLLSSLKKYFRLILVISHVDGIKDVADHILEITKNEKDSRVVYT
jgi:DNA repair exonuclease SbcCD ATPase subunit/DNA repair exonuclease SbcCD nuclease subunit